MGLEELRRRLIANPAQWGDTSPPRVPSHNSHPQSKLPNGVLVASTPDAQMNSVQNGRPHPSKGVVTTKGWTLQHLLEKSPNFRPIPRLSASENELNAQIDLYDQHTKPLIVEGCHHQSSWPSEMFKPEGFFASNATQLIVRNVHDWTDQTMATSDFLEWSRSAKYLVSENETERYYAKDAVCPKEWADWLNNFCDIPKSLLPKGPSNLMSRQPESEQVETLMCYIGIGDTFTACHKDLCASSGQNLMCYTENGGSSFWFMTDGRDASDVALYFHNLKQELDHETHILTLEELANAPFTVYIGEQKLGDLVLVPPRSCHQVVNNGGITIKTSWSRMTLNGLRSALYHELPVYQRVCRPEIYRVKSTIRYALMNVVSQLESADSIDTPHPHTANKPSQSELELLFELFDSVLVDEYPLTDAKLNVVEPEVGHIVCDFCGADVFQSFLECRTCVTDVSGVATNNDSYVVCPSCYAEGRSCFCSTMDLWQCRPFSSLLQDRERAVSVFPSGRQQGIPNVESLFLAPGTFRAACILRNLQNSKIKGCSVGRPSSHNVPASWALQCKRCPSTRCFSHLLADFKMHSVDALSVYHQDQKHDLFHSKHVKTRLGFENAVDSLRTAERMGLCANKGHLRTRVASTFRSCKPLNSRKPGFYDAFIQLSTEDPKVLPGNVVKNAKRVDDQTPDQIEEGMVIDAVNGENDEAAQLDDNLTLSSPASPLTPLPSSSSDGSSPEPIPAGPRTRRPRKFAPPSPRPHRLVFSHVAVPQVRLIVKSGAAARSEMSNLMNQADADERDTSRTANPLRRNNIHDTPLGSLTSISLSRLERPANRSLNRTRTYSPSRLTTISGARAGPPVGVTMKGRTAVAPSIFAAPPKGNALVPGHTKESSRSHHDGKGRIKARLAPTALDLPRRASGFPQTSKSPQHAASPSTDRASKVTLASTTKPCPSSTSARNHSSLKPLAPLSPRRHLDLTQLQFKKRSAENPTTSSNNTKSHQRDTPNTAAPQQTSPPSSGSSNKSTNGGSTPRSSTTSSSTTAVDSSVALARALNNAQEVNSRSMGTTVIERRAKPPVGNPKTSSASEKRARIDDSEGGDQEGANAEILPRRSSKRVRSTTPASSDLHLIDRSQPNMDRKEKTSNQDSGASAGNLSRGASPDSSQTKSAESDRLLIRELKKKTDKMEEEMEELKRSRVAPASGEVESSARLLGAILDVLLKNPTSTPNVQIVVPSSDQKSDQISAQPGALHSETQEHSAALLPVPASAGPPPSAPQWSSESRHEEDDMAPTLPTPQREGPGRHGMHYSDRRHALHCAWQETADSHGWDDHSQWTSGSGEAHDRSVYDTNRRLERRSWDRSDESQQRRQHQRRGRYQSGPYQSSKGPQGHHDRHSSRHPMRQRDQYIPERYMPSWRTDEDPQQDERERHDAYAMDYTVFDVSRSAGNDARSPEDTPRYHGRNLPYLFEGSEAGGSDSQETSLGILDGRSSAQSAENEAFWEDSYGEFDDGSEIGFSRRARTPLPRNPMALARMARPPSPLPGFITENPWVPMSPRGPV